MGVRVGARERLQPARVACIVTGKHVVCRERSERRGVDGGGGRERLVKERWGRIYGRGVLTASSGKICVPEKSKI